MGLVGGGMSELTKTQADAIRGFLGEYATLCERFGLMVGDLYCWDRPHFWAIDEAVELTRHLDYLKSTGLGMEDE
jgi:hypothetical protein